MVCDKCKNAGVLNTVLNKSFYYCKTCKEEILLEDPVFPLEEKPLTENEIAELLSWNTFASYIPDDLL